MSIAVSGAPAPVTPPVVSARGLTKRFGDKAAVDNLDLTIEAGVIYGFLGPNGCGKTTSMRLLTGLLTPTSGEVEVLGNRLPQGAEALKRQIGYMTQTFSLYRDLSVRENLAFSASIHGFRRKAARTRIDELLTEFDLTELSSQWAGSMSGGQRQRLALATAVLHRPGLLILDEPTSAVDPESRRLFWEKLFDLVVEGTSIIVSTHFMDEAERCHRLAILDRGVKRADGAPFDLMDGLGVRVAEVTGTDLREIKRRLEGLPDVISASQIGTRLRVMLGADIDDPVAYLRTNGALEADHEVSETRPNLEDVFIFTTRGST